MIVPAARTEPSEVIIRATASADVAEQFAAITADMRDRRVPITPLGVLSRALDVGVPEAVAVSVAALVGQVGP